VGAIDLLIDREIRSTDVVSQAHAINAIGLEKDYILQLDANTQWEKYLLPAPMAVSLIGQMIVLSSIQDFPLKPPRAGGSYQRIRHLHFRPTLIQLANEGWRSFEQAHTNMHQVRLLTGSIPRYLKLVLRLLASQKQPAIKKFVPISLKAIRRSADQSTELSLEIERGFFDMMDLLKEIDEALAATSGHAEESILNITKEMQQAEEEKRFVDNLYKETKKEFDKLEKTLAEDRRKYIEAVKKIPSGWKATMRGLMRSFRISDIIGIVTTGWIGLAITAVKSITQRKGSSSGTSLTGGTYGSGPSPKQLVEDQMILHYASNMYNTVGSFPSQINLVIDRIQASQLPAVQDKISHLAQEADTTNQGLLVVKDRISSLKSSTFYDETMKTCTATITETGKLRDLFRTNINNAHLNNITLISNRFLKIINVLKVLSSARAIQTGAPDVGSPTSGGGGGSGGDPERFVAQQRLQTLLANTRRYEIYYQHLTEANDKVTKVMVEIAGLRHDRLSMSKIRNLLRRGIVALTEFRKIWNALSSFFQMIAGLTSVTLENGVKSFYETSELSASLGILDSTVQSSIQEDATRIATVSEFIHTIAQTYSSVSDQYLMKELTNLPSLLEIEDKRRQNSTLHKLLVDATKAQQEISRMVNRQREAFRQRSRIQKKEIESIFKAVGKPSADDLKAIETAKEWVENYEAKCLLDCNG
jgi:hypothetical protein